MVRRGVHADAAIVLEPLHRRLSQRMPPNRSAAIITLLILGIAGLGLLFLASVLIRGGGAVLSMFGAINQWLETIRPGGIVSGMQAANAINSLLAFLKAQILPILLSIPMIIFNALILILSVYLFLLKGPEILRQIGAALPGRLNQSLEKISGLVASTMFAIYIVSLEVAFLSFLLALPIYYLLGYPAYTEMAILTGLSMFIPIFGPLLVMIFLVLFNLATGNIPGAFVAVLIVYPIVMWIPGNYLRPRLMGKRVSIHPVLMMIGIIGGISIMGLYGLILAPLFIALLVASYEILIDQLTLAKGQAGEQIPP
jgi:predicted PurR-regulated permease PerM